MGRGRSSLGGGATGGVSGGNVLSTTSLISERERKQAEVDATLTVLRAVDEQYGVDMTDVQIATMDRRGASTMGYYDAEGNLAINTSYFDSAKMDAAYDGCVQAGFHPSRGTRSGLEAVVAHEAGHRLTDVAAQRLGLGTWQLDAVSNRIVAQAAKATGQRAGALRAAISGYARKSNAEAVAEAFADVFCNGNRASRSSRAVVDALNSILGV